jgi:hypothetical protein
MFSCLNRASKPLRNSQINKIVFATGECKGTCALQAIEIDSTLSYKYFGGKRAIKQGYYKGFISSALWDSITGKFEKANFKNWDSSYKESFDTWPGEMVLYYSGKRKHIILMDNDLPDSLRQLFYWMAEIPQKIALKQTADSLQFETWVQNGFPRIQNLPIRKFIPPVSN